MTNAFIAHSFLLEDVIVGMFVFVIARMYTCAIGNFIFFFFQKPSNFFLLWECIKLEFDSFGILDLNISEFIFEFLLIEFEFKLNSKFDNWQSWSKNRPHESEKNSFKRKHVQHWSFHFPSFKIWDYSLCMSKFCHEEQPANRRHTT